MLDLVRPYRDLLSYHLGETRRWFDWLATRPAAAQVTIGHEPQATVRDLAAHVVLVDLAYVHRLRGMPPVDPDGPLRDAPWSDLRAHAERAAALLDDWLLSASPADLDREIAFGGMGVVATARSVVTHVLIHGARHWAQIATYLRQHDVPQDWPHDYLLLHPR